MAKNRIFCSTGALIGRWNCRDFTLLLGCAEALECDGFEFMMYNPWHERVDELISFLKTLDAVFPVFHTEKDIGNLISRNGEGDIETAIDLFKKNCAVAREIGSEKLVLHLWGGIDSDKDINNNINVYKRLREISDAFGLLLTVENVVCNRADPMSNLKRLSLESPDASFTFDTKMSEFHNQTEMLYDKENEWLFSRIRHMHINDYNGGYMDWSNLKTLHIGEGRVDFCRLFEFLKSKEFAFDFTVEATSFDQSGALNLDALNKTFAKIRKYLA